MTAVSDSFERPDDPASLGAAVTGGLWVPRPTAPHDSVGSGFPLAQITSVLGIDDGLAYGSGSPGYAHLATIDHETPEVDVELGLELPFAPGSGAGMAVRWQGPTEFFECVAYRRVSFPSHYFAFVRRIDSPTEWEVMPEADSVFLAVTGSTGPHTLGIRVNGPEWSFSWDGADAGNFFEPSYPTATDHGILTYFTSARIIDSYNGVDVRGGFAVGAVSL